MSDVNIKSKLYSCRCGKKKINVFQQMFNNRYSFSCINCQ